MDLSTVNVIIGTVIASTSSAILFALGVIVTYVRSINRSLNDMLLKITEHKTKIELHEEQIKDIYNRLNRME